MTELLNPPATLEPINVRSHDRQHGERTTPAVRPLRIAWLTNEIPPYRVPFYSELAGTPGWYFQVFTCTDREVYRLWNVQAELSFAVQQSYSLSYVRRNRHAGPENFDDIRQVHLPVGLFGDLRRFSPDVIVSGELGARTLIAALYSRLFNRRLVVSFEGTPHTERDISPAQHWLRRVIRRAPHAFTVDGRQGAQYLHSLGVPARSIFEMGQAIETETFGQELTPDARAAVRRNLAIQGLCYLFCGRLIALKGVDQLLDAWEVFARQADVNATLLLVGEGSERGRLERRVADAGLTNVRFLGHLQRDALPAIYQAADYFVFPTLMDCWALAVNEAMAAALPVINSKYTGSADIIVDGETGWVVDPFDRNDMVDKLRRAWDVQHQRSTMRNAVRKTIANYSIPVVADRIRRVVDEVRPINCSRAYVQ